jgi:plastocyanin
VSAIRTTALAAVIAAFLVAPPALLAEQTSSEAGLSSAGRATYDAAARPSATVGQTAASASLRTADSGSSESTGTAPSASSSAAVSVTIGDFFFRPQDVTVTAGEAVTWTNEGTVPEGHTATGDGFDSGVLKEGQSFSHTFEEAGSFDYVCTLHPNMRGTITVTAAGSGGGSGGGGGAAQSGGGTETGGLQSAPTTPTTSSSDDGSLAQTGLNLILLAEIAGCFIATGLLIRRLIYG